MLYTMDHNTGEVRLDLQHGWASGTPPQPIPLPLDQRCDSEVIACLFHDWFFGFDHKIRKARRSVKRRCICFESMAACPCPKSCCS